MRSVRLQVLALCLALFSGTANATVYTAVVSGDFSSAITWGGILPGSILSSDVVIIPSGITVNLTSIQTISGTSTLNVGGTLTSSSSAAALVVTSGTLSGAGTINVDSMVLGLTSGFTFTGTLMARKLRSTGASIGTSAVVKVHDALDLSAGTLTLSDGSLTMGNYSMITRAGGSIATSGSGLLVLDSVYSVAYTATSTTGMELNGTGLADILVNTAGTVTLSASTSVNGMLTLTAGNLALNGKTLTLNSMGYIAGTGTGTIMGSATSNIVVNTTSTLTTNLRFASSGNVLNNLTINTAGAGNVMLWSDLNIDGTMTLSSGGFALNGYGLTFSTTGNMSATGTGTLTGDAGANLIVNSTAGLTGMLNFTSGSRILNNLTVNTGGSSSATLGSDLAIGGSLTLTGGTLALNGHSLTINTTGDIAASGSGNLSGSALSDLVINSTAGLTGTLRFATAGSMLRNLHMNAGAGTASTLGTDLTILGDLNLQAGRLKLGASNLMLAAGAMVSGGSAGSYVITDGAGKLVKNLVAGATDTFEVGSMMHFAPMAVTAASGSASGDVSINVADGVLSGGTTGTLVSSTAAVVNMTWFVSSTATAGINYNLTAMWDAGMEVNGFDRSDAYLSHYTGGAWDVTAGSAAGMSGSMYTMSRTGITSLSPFMVAQEAPTGTQIITADQMGMVLYPNPAFNTLHYDGTLPVDNIKVTNMAGRVVLTDKLPSGSLDVSDLPAGVYVIHFVGVKGDITQRFEKK